MYCSCGAEIEPIDRFCGECGRPLTEDGLKARQQETGAPARSSDPRDHVEIEISPDFAAVSDRGRRHARNEDDAALAVNPAGGAAAILVVSDGMSVSLEPQLASRLAVQAAKASLVSGTVDEASVRAAILNAHAAVTTIQGGPDKDDRLGNAAATIAIAVIRPSGSVLVGWIGDSRVYALSPAGVRQLTHDHSWVNEVVDNGTMSYEEAILDRQRAHGLVRWIGDQGDGSMPEPDVRRVALHAHESVVVCSDGLWNYAPLNEDMARLYATTGGSAIEICRQLTAFANARGGVDNITVALFRR